VSPSSRKSTYGGCTRNVDSARSAHSCGRRGTCNDGKQPALAQLGLARSIQLLMVRRQELWRMSSD
jgi:hypothetical protein